MRNLILFMTVQDEKIFKQLDQYVQGHTLDLSQKRLVDEAIRRIPAYLRQHPEISAINLANQRPLSQSKSLNALAICLADLPQLRSINLENCSLSDHAIEVLAQNTVLETLNVNMNIGITDLGADHLMQNTTLKSISISACGLSQEKRDQMVRYFQQKNVNIDAKLLGVKLQKIGLSKVELRSMLTLKTMEINPLISVVEAQKIANEVANQIEFDLMVQPIKQFVRQYWSTGLSVAFISTAEYFNVPRLFTGLILSAYHADNILYPNVVAISAWFKEHGAAYIQDLYEFTEELNEYVVNTYGGFGAS